MKRTTTVLAVAIGATALGIGLASPAAADPSNCQTVGPSTVCGQGNIRGGGQSAGAQGVAPGPAGGTCQNAYGVYQNCNAGHG